MAAMVRGAVFLVFVLVGLGGAARADGPGRACSSGRLGHVECIREAHFVHDTCQAIAHFSARAGLDTGFFARLIWQESRFDPHALSPAGALGIAQFMPRTARLRGLSDPLNPALALEHAALYLAEMSGRYGNIGLAAAGYNGGEARVEALIAGTGGLARETVDYVAIVTGLGFEAWLEPTVTPPDLRLSRDLPFRAACHALARKRRLSPMPRPEPRLKPFGVQLAFATTRKGARAAFRSKTRACAGLIGNERPDLVWQKSRASARGGYWMARIGRHDQRAALSLCRKLRAQGCICAVFRNRK